MQTNQMTREQANVLIRTSAAKQRYHNCDDLPDFIFLDKETLSSEDLKKHGLDKYANHDSTRVLMVTWCEDGTKWYHWNYLMGEFPRRLTAILTNPDVKKRAFNAQFERTMCRTALGLGDSIGYDDWQCTMCHAFMMGFSGTLDQVGTQMGLPSDLAKMKEGGDLIKFFSCPVPEKQRKANGGREFRDPLDHEEKWMAYCLYNVMDVVAEMGIAVRIDKTKYPIPPSEWRLYAIDQQINDRGVPVDMRMAHNAVAMRDQRKEELLTELRHITKLANPNSTQQLLPWLKERGYPFDDLKSATVKTALKRFESKLAEDAIVVLKKRRWASATSPGKYSTITKAAHAGRFRFAFQFSGAARTQRWAGRRVQMQNLPRTPKCIEPDNGDIRKLNITTECLRKGRYDELALWMKEPMEAIVGCIRSAFRAEDDHEFRVCDLASIESVVTGWLTDCKWFQEVLGTGKDIYKSFAMHIYDKAYDEVSKFERGMAKPATLGCGYRLGGGFETEDFKRTGLWGYAENMGIDMTQQEAADHVAIFRELCPEIVKYWKDLEYAVQRCVERRIDVQCGRVTFEWRAPFVAIRLPSGRRLWYYQPKMIKKTMKNKDGEEWTKLQFTYMGQDQKTKKWTRQFTHGGKLVENIVQAIARDILKAGLMRAAADGFKIVMHVHDEIVAHERKDNTYHTQERLQMHMTAPLKWAPGMHLGGAGWCGPFYMKD